MKLFCAGLETETNTFSPIPTGLKDFHITRQSDLSSAMDPIKQIAPFAQWLDMASADNHKMTFGLYGWAQPAGFTAESAYQQLLDELLAAVKAAGDIDIVLLLLHGAMVTQQIDDCEGDLLLRLRQQLGPDVVIAAELDLHCHLTEQMLANADILISYKEYPHTDVAARGVELYQLAYATACKQCQPVMVQYDCQLIGMYPTSSPVMQEFVDTLMAAEQEKNILSVSFIHGFPFGDVPDAGGKILVVADADQQQAARVAEQLGRHILSLRHQIGFNSLPLEAALTAAMAAIKGDDRDAPVVVADQSDNPGGGAPGDATFALRWLLQHQVSDVALAIFYDPQIVQLAMAVGQGATLAVRLGGKMGPASGDPLDLTVEVGKVIEHYSYRFPQTEGPDQPMPLGDTVALHTQGIDIIVSSIRCQCFSPCIFEDFAIAPQKKSLLVVKSAQHFYAAFAPIAKQVIYMAGPGAVPPLIKQIPYKRMSTADKYPWVDKPFAINPLTSKDAM